MRHEWRAAVGPATRWRIGRGGHGCGLVGRGIAVGASQADHVVEAVQRREGACRHNRRGPHLLRARRGARRAQAGRPPEQRGLPCGAGTEAARASAAWLSGRKGAEEPGDTDRWSPHGATSAPPGSSARADATVQAPSDAAPPTAGASANMDGRPGWLPAAVQALGAWLRTPGGRPQGTLELRGVSMAAALVPAWRGVRGSCCSCGGCWLAALLLLPPMLAPELLPE